MEDAAGFAGSDGAQKHEPGAGEGMVDQPEGAEIAAEGDEVEVRLEQVMILHRASQERGVVVVTQGGPEPIRFPIDHAPRRSLAGEAINIALEQALEFFIRERAEGGGVGAMGGVGVVLEAAGEGADGQRAGERQVEVPFGAVRFRAELVERGVPATRQANQAQGGEQFVERVGPRRLVRAGFRRAGRFEMAGEGLAIGRAQIPGFNPIVDDRADVGAAG